MKNDIKFVLKIQISLLEVLEKEIQWKEELGVTIKSERKDNNVEEKEHETTDIIANIIKKCKIKNENLPCGYIRETIAK